MKRLSLNNLRTDLRTFAGLALTFACLIAFLSLVGCAPEVKGRDYPTPKTDFGPLHKDIDLGLESMTQKPKIDPSKIVMKGEFSSARVFRVAEWMIELGQVTGRKPLIEASRRMTKAFYEAPGTTTLTPFENTLYASAAVGETKEDSLLTIRENDQMIEANVEALLLHLEDLGKRFPWPKPGEPPRVLLDSAEAFANTMLDETADKLDPRFYSALVKGMDTKFYPIIRDARLEVDSIFAEPRPLDIIRRFKDLALRNDFEFGEESQQLINKGERIFALIESMREKHDALTVIVELWEMTDPKEREKTFKPVSKDLFEYLDGKGAKDLRCVKNPDCKNPLIWVPKQVAILPALKKYGLDKLKTDIRAAAREGLIETIHEEVALIVPDLPAEAGKRVLEEVGSIRSQLSSINADYGSFVKGLVQDFGREHLKKDPQTPNTLENSWIPGVEADKVEVNIGAGRIDIRAKERANTVATGAETLGTSLALNAALWQAEPAVDNFDFRRQTISQINKILAIGGFKTEKGKPFESLALSLDPKSKNKYFYIRDFISSTSGYAVPDRFDVAVNYASNGDDDDLLDVSVRGQAELLRGLSAMIRYFRDWEKNAFDDSIGKVAIGEMIKNLPAEALTQKLFPKDMMFALAVGNAASILQNMTKENSPAFIVKLDRQTMWANQMGSGNPDDVGTTAGIVDVKQGVRGDTVNTGDVARFLIALVEFMDAVEGIERTQAGPLIEKDEEGKRPIDVLVESKADIRLLAVGLANMLSHELQGKDGGLRSSFKRSTVTVNSSQARSLRDQAIAIMALLRVSDLLGKDIYEWAALDAFSFMNKNLWNPKTGFYRATEGKEDVPSLDEATMALLAGERLRLKMNEKSRAQWDMIAEPWLQALESL